MEIQKVNGVAGQYGYKVRTNEGESVAFYGSVYGGPVVMETQAGQTFVTDPGRFGEFGCEWVERFLAA